MPSIPVFGVRDMRFQIDGTDVVSLRIADVFLWQFQFPASLAGQAIVAIGVNVEFGIDLRNGIGRSFDAERSVPAGFHFAHVAVGSDIFVQQFDRWFCARRCLVTASEFSVHNVTLRGRVDRVDDHGQDQQCVQCRLHSGE